jgi:hypothetical protein
MTRQEAIRVLFDCGLPLLEDNARDLAKQDDRYDGPISEHPQVKACKEAIAVLRAELEPGNSSNDTWHRPGALHA